MPPRLSSAPGAFVCCRTCTHAALARSAAAACRMCGGEVAEVVAPPDVREAWRCGCFQCTWTPC